MERKVPAVNSSKTITDIEVQFGGVITVKIFGF